MLDSIPVQAARREALAVVESRLAGYRNRISNGPSDLTRTQQAEVVRLWYDRLALTRAGPIRVVTLNGIRARWRLPEVCPPALPDRIAIPVVVQMAA